MKIKQKLILAFASFALLIWVVGHLAVNTSQKALRKSIGESSVFLAAEILDKIDRNLYNKIERFQSFQDPSLQETIIKSNQEFENSDDIQEYIDEKDKEWTAAPEETVTPFMKDLISNELSKALRKRAKFYEEKHGFRVFAEVFVTNKYGANVGQTGKTTDYRQDDEEWWQKAKKEGLYVRDVEHDRSAKVYSTDVGIRIDDDNKNFLGVVKVVLNIEEVINIIKEVEAAIEYEHEEIHLVNKDGKVIYAKYHEPFENISEKKYFKEITGNKGYFITKAHHVGGGDALYSYAHSKGYKDFKGLGWIILIEYNAEEIFAPAARLRNHILIISLVVTILAVLLGLFISTSISKPVTKLRDAATAIGKGNLDTQIETKSNDEIGELAASFNDMASKLKESQLKLKESHKQLEEKVKERTAELSSANAKLEGEVEQRTLAQKTLEERIKELNCLFGLSKLVEQPEISLEQIFEKTVHLIRKAYQYPDATCVRITFEGVQYKTDNFEKSELGQYAQIKIHGDKAGDIEVYYLGEKPESGQSPFLKEESDLLDAVAKHLGSVAERKKTGEKLQLFRDLIDQSNDAVFIVEPQWGRFLDANDRACASLGYTRKELLNMTVKDIEEVIPDDSAWTKHVRQVRKKGYMVLEGRYKRKDGTTSFVETSLKLVSQEDGEHIIAVARDITEHKQAEEKQAELLEKVESINKELKDFAYIVSHDLKAPLRGIRTLADWIGSDYADKLDDEGREQMGLLSSRVDRMHNLIDGVLEYSRVGREKEKQVQVNLNELVPEIIDVIAPPENVTITVEDKLPVVECGQTRIMQVFQNLLSNAVKYMDKPKGRVKVGCVEEDGFWKFSVADNGPGIEEKHFERIFRIFQTLSPRDEVESTGVGLSVVKKIVELYGGKIWVESKPGKGSTFFFTLPGQEMGVKNAKLEVNIVG